MSGRDNFASLEQMARDEYNRIVCELGVSQDRLLPFERVFSPLERQWEIQLENGCNDYLFYCLFRLYNIYRDIPTARLFLRHAGTLGDDVLQRLGAYDDIISFWSHQQQYQKRDRLRRHYANKTRAIDGDGSAPDWGAKIEKATFKSRMLYLIKNDIEATGISSEQFFSSGLESFEGFTADTDFECFHARDLLKKASDMGHRDAPYYLGLIYLYGLGNGTSCNIENNEKLSLSFFQLAESRGNIRAIFHLAALALTDDNIDDALAFLRRVSEAELGKRFSEEENYIIAIGKLYIAHHLATSNDEIAYHRSETLCRAVLDFSVIRYITQDLSEITFADPDWRAISIFSNSYLHDIGHLKDIKRKEEEKRKAIEDLMAMVSHQFRGEICTILYNAEHENDKKRYLHAARTMSGLIELTGILSTKPDDLLISIANDNIGEGSPSVLLLYSIKDLLIDLSDIRNRERMSPYYLVYSKRQGLAPNSLGLADWSENPEWQELEEKLRIQWQSECETLETSNFEALCDWLETRILPVQIIGLSESRLRFSRYGVKASILRVIFTELVKNAIKHSYPDAGESIILTWSEKDDDISLSCSNPSSFGSRMRNKGSGRGHSFLSLLANSLGGTFENHVFANPSWVCLHLPKLA